MDILPEQIPDWILATIIVILLIERIMNSIFTHISKDPNNPSSSSPQTADINCPYATHINNLLANQHQIIKLNTQQTDTLNNLYKMHQVRDEDGVPIWYTRQSLYRAIDTIAQTLSEQHRILKHLARITTNTHHKDNRTQNDP